VLEAVIVLPAMIVLAMLVIQYALVWHGKHVAQAAAQTGLRVARGFESTPQAGDQAVRDYLADVAPNLLQNPNVTTTQTATTTTVTVKARVLPLMSFGDLTITQQASGPRELFVAP
jgi:Flp pilus assembly protein TadG